MKLIICRFNVDVMLMPHSASNFCYTKLKLKVHYVRVHIKILSWKFRILNPRDSRLIYPYEMFVYKHTETIEYVKN